ncbi:MAG: nucleotide exchange factor GrpE [Planctomycetaceae bacterium]
MNDSAFHSESSGEPSRWDDPPRDEAPDEAPDETPDETPPQFGMVDVVEAFTAMRHEWRGQTKESRALAEQIQAAVTSLQSLEAKRLARAADSRPEDSAESNESNESKQLAELIAQTDHQLSRAVAAITQWEADRRLREAADAQAIERYFAGMNAVARWFARPLLRFIAEQHPVPEPTAENPAIEGLSLVLARLRRMMKEHHIERLDAEGQVFDAATMNAIGTVASPDCPSGHVAEQLSPAYRWQGRLLRFADVRVAK